MPDLNPDGAAAGTRGNAHGVDLNRNFPWHWQRVTWESHRFPRASSFVVELPGGTLSPAAAARLARAVRVFAVPPSG